MDKRSASDSNLTLNFASQNAESLSFKFENKASAKTKLISRIWGLASKLMPFHHLSMSDKHLSGPKITINGQTLINFGSCSYLGLEQHPKVKEGAVSATKAFGTQFSSSTTYLRVGAYTELNALYNEIFGIPTIIAPSTTLAHCSVIPIVVKPGDLVLLDAQVHNSVQMALKLVDSQRIKTVTLPHNDMNILESKLKAHSDLKQSIWYFCDGVYSMFGDFAPIEELNRLKSQYPNLNVYVDDAHGMSWIGTKGSGFALSRSLSLTNTVLVTSQAKGFGCGGASILISDPKRYKEVSQFGQTLIFSGPIQPPILGACIASAEIHLSDELPHLQSVLQHKMQLRNELFIHYKLPFKGDLESPISFLGVGRPEVLGDMFKYLFDSGYYVNCAIFPAVSRNHGGIRSMLNPLINDSDIEKFASILAEAYKTVLGRHKVDVGSVTALCHLAL